MIWLMSSYSDGQQGSSCYIKAKSIRQSPAVINSGACRFVVVIKNYLIPVQYKAISDKQPLWYEFLYL